MGVSRKQSAPNFPKNEHFQGVRNARFLENLAWFVFLKYLFWDLFFCLITDVFIFYSPRKHLNTKDYFMMFSGELRTLGRNSVMLKTPKNLACFVFLKHPFWDSFFCLITDMFPFYSPRKHLNTKDYFVFRVVGNIGKE